MERAPLVLVFPPHWYYTSVPADLLYTGSFLRGHDVPVHRLFDDYDGAILGEAETPLLALWHAVQGGAGANVADVPGLLAPRWGSPGARAATRRGPATLPALDPAVEAEREPRHPRAV